jgi:murein DD-endopeptidase MepM/ murein hydrolase activator NlpD
VNPPSPPIAIAAFFLLANFLVSPTTNGPAAAPTTPPPLPAVVITSKQPAPVPAEAAAIPTPPVTHLVRVSSGDTLMGLLIDQGVATSDAQEAIDALKPVWSPRDLKIGQQLTLQFAAARLQELHFAPAIDRDVVVARAGDGHFASHAAPHPLTHVPQFAGGVIHTSLFDAASDAGVPMPILAEMIHAFSYDVDFQREVRPEDSFEVVFDRLYDESGKAVGAGNIAYAAMTLSGNTLRIYRYTPAGDSRADFFDAKGASVRKALLRTPVDGARLSSGFGMRFHPILGYTKMHRGVDFAVPSGTPIMAAGDGLVETAGYAGDYGNFVLLRHSNSFETAYAHMSRVATHTGQRVHQGQVIGYVGATGRATGPHLHYEVRIAGQATNPLSIKMQPGPLLAGKELTAFRAVADAVDRRLPVLRGEPVVAAMSSRQPN